MIGFQQSRSSARQQRRDRGAPYLSIVVACHNEAAGLRELYRRVAAVLDGLLKPGELVLVDDGSSDATWEAMRAICAIDGRVVAVSLSRNFGQQAAITAGLARARGERVLVLDADLQDPPELVFDMLDLMDTGADVVHARRCARRDETRFKRASAAAFYWLLERLSETPIARDTGEFRLMSRRAVEAILAMPERHRFTRGLAAWVGFRQASIEYDRAGRFAGSTHWPLRQMTKLAIDAITAFSTRPLALAAWLGLAVCGVGAMLLVWLVASAIVAGAIDGALAIVTAVTLLSGLQLLMLGVQGAYLGRLYEQSRGRPLFIVSDVIGGELDVLATRGRDGVGQAVERPLGSTAEAMVGAEER